MDHFLDKILFQTKQHKIVLVLWFLKHFFMFVLPISLISFYLFKLTIIFTSIITIVLSFFFFFLVYFFWSKSYFLITNKKISLKVRNWFFSKYHMSIYYTNIKDIAYSKSNIMHYLFNYWTVFARSSAWAGWDFEWTALPNVEKIYKYINNIYLLSEEKRDVLDSLETLEWNIIKDIKKENVDKTIKEEVLEETLDEIIKKETDILLKIKWLKEVIVIDNNDRAFIFDNEEDRNHWIYEVLRKKVIFAVTHDFDFREPDEAIVLKKWKKVVFPTVKFHEIKRSWVISASPWIKVHNYLKDKFENLGADDATILIWFDI